MDNKRKIKRNTDTEKSKELWDIVEKVADSAPEWSKKYLKKMKF